MTFNDKFTFIQESEREFKLFSVEDELTIFHYTYYPKYSLSVQKWIGSLENEDVIQVYQRMMLFTKEQKQTVRISISDLTEAETSFHLTNEWVAKVLIPDSIKWGYSYTLFVQAKEFLAQLALEDAIKNLSEIEGLKEVRIFNSLEDAYQYAIQLL